MTENQAISDVFGSVVSEFWVMEQKIFSSLKENFNDLPNIMIVDDDPVCHLIGKKIAKKSGCVGQIQEAWDGNDALQQLTNALSLKLQLPDIILLDINMPMLDGFEFLAAFQQIKRQMKKFPKVVVLSSSILPRDQQRAKALGADDVLEKPLTATSFSKVISAYADKADVVSLVR